MVVWRNRKARIEREANKSLIEKLSLGQQNSLLQEFIDFANDTHHLYGFSVTTSISRDGMFTVVAGFEGERGIQFNLLGDLPFEAMEDPANFLASLCNDEEFDEIKEALHETEALLARLRVLLSQTSKTLTSHRELCVRLGNRASQRTLLDLIEWERLEEELKEMVTEREGYLENIWYESPYFQERLCAIYREFLLQRTVRPSDPVEADLVAILDNEKVSEQTKAKARSVLHDYRGQRAEKVEEDVNTAEQEANLILSTIEQHYLKKVKH